MEKDTSYIGNELELFEHAQNWKNYWGGKVSPFLGERVLEVGAGLGGTTRHLVGNGAVKEWICLEPDSRLSNQIKKTLADQPGLDSKVEVVTSYLAEYPEREKFDSILYIDVIEHIENEVEELKRAAQYLKKNGALIIIVPAHNFLFSEFDKAIGHFRRYSRANLMKVIPSGLSIEQVDYLDSVGLLASLANKVLLKQAYPSLKQIRFWDSTLVPVSKVVDKLIGFNLGKSLLLIAKKN